MKTRSIILLASLLFSPIALAQNEKPAEKPAQTPAPTTDKSKDAPAPAPAAEKLVYVRMSTTQGDMVFELNNEKAPISTANFLSYVDSGFYNGTIFHRVMVDFMIQGGGFTKDGKQKATSAPIQNEWKNGLKNTKYTLAMARRGDRKPNDETVNSATSQFFINTGENASLDMKQPDGGAYAVFGKVVEGTDVVDKIRSAKITQDPRGEPSKPLEPVEITSAVRLTKEQAAKYAPAGEASKEEKPAEQPNATPKDGK